MGEVITDQTSSPPSPFNSPLEIGLRALVVLNEAYPLEYSLQRLVVLDYLIVHSDDIPDGPEGLHPKTPHRNNELLVRRKVLNEGLHLYQSRGLISQRFQSEGIYFGATESSSSFLDVLQSEYVIGLRQRAQWARVRFGADSDEVLTALVRDQIGNWGAEFTLESVLWNEEQA
jgi:hypothetical protein